MNRQANGLMRRAGVLKRRGLLGGVAALLGAGLAKLQSPERAEATHYGDGGDVGMGQYNNRFDSRPTFIANSDDTEPAFGGINGKIPGTTNDYVPFPDGIQAITNKTGGAGLRGIAPDFAVIGQVNRGGAPISNSAVGVLGQTSFGAAVRGEVSGASSTGTGVVGVAGGCDFGNASSVGVGGSGRVAGGLGGSKTGVLGITGTGIGVEGWATNGGTGIRGSANFGGGPDFGGSGIGVEGRSGSGRGVVGQSNSGIGVQGFSTAQIAVRGDSANNYGVFGTSPLTALRGEATGSGVGFVGIAGPGPGSKAGQFVGDVLVQGSFTVSGGAKSAAVPHPDGSHRRMYCQESPEPWFEDFGTATLANGRAEVALDPDFDAVVKGDDYLVFTMPEGDCKGLFVSRKGPHRFVVEELQGGKSSLPFSYRVVSRRREAVGARLEKVDVKGPPNPKSPPQKVGPDGRLMQS